MNHYEILVDSKLLHAEFEYLVTLERDIVANWNKNRYGYIASLLLENYQAANNKSEFIEQALEYPSLNTTVTSVRNRRKLTIPLIGEGYKGACLASSTLKTLIGLIESHLSAKKILRFIPQYQQNFARNKNIFKSSIFQALPELPMCVLAMSTSSIVDQVATELPKNWVKSYKKNIEILDTYSNKAAAIATYRRLVFTLGIPTFNLLTDKAVSDFRQIDDNTSSRAYGLAVGFFRELGAFKLSLEGVAATQKFRDKHKKNKAQVYISSGNINNQRINDDGFYMVTARAAYNLCGLTDVIISVKRAQRNKKISIGEYQFNDTWSSYSFEKFANSSSPWIKSQREYVNSFSESGTKKNVGIALQYLNVYLFHYLRYFFSSNKVPYPYPEKISDFKNAIFVAPSEIISSHLYQSVNVTFPISLLEWLKISGEAHKESVVKARARTISDYFDYVLSKYKGIDGYELDKNPLSTFDLKSIQGSAYKRSNKKLLKLEYWKLFTEFLSVLADTLISSIESNSYIPKNGDYSINVDRQIEFGDYRVHIGQLENIKISRCIVNGQTYPQPQYVLAFLVAAKSGIRLSSAMNLDVRSYDRFVEDLNQYEIGDLVEIEVNTDKAKSSAFKTAISYSTFKLLKRFVDIRDQITGVPVQPIPYKGENNSKWGNVLPILATSTRGGYDQAYKVLPSLLHAFELELTRAGVALESEVFYKPTFHSTRSFESLCRSGMTTSIDEYCLHYKDGDTACFTPIEISSYVTPHSFRKTVATYYSVLVGDKQTGQFFTGQTESTVGYYREVTPEGWNKVMSYAGMESLPNVVPVKSVFKDEEEIRNKLLKEGLIGVKGFTLSALETDVRLDLTAVDPSDIAINRTHICIYGNTCPPEILASLEGKKNCAICPVSIGTPHDGVAIAAQIKYHVDNISEINQQLKDDDLLSAEKNCLIATRAEELNQACSWFVRHKFILGESQRNDEYVVLNDGGDKVRAKLEYIIPKNGDEEIYARLMETKSLSSIQSNKLKQVSSRLARKLVKILDKTEIELPSVKPVEVAVALIRKVAEVHGLRCNQLNELIQEPIGNTSEAIEDLLRLGGLDEGQN